MPDNIRFSSPDTMQKPPGYSHVVEVTGPGRTVYFAGQLGIDKSGRMGANAREQMEIAFENVKAALASVGAGFEHVVKLNNYVVDIGANLAHYREVRDKYVNTVSPPASTTVGVPQLARPGKLFRLLDRDVRGPDQLAPLRLFGANALAQFFRRAGNGFEILRVEKRLPN